MYKVLGTFKRDSSWFNSARVHIYCLVCEVLEWQNGPAGAS
jgi:hypothetical protein